MSDKSPALLPPPVDYDHSLHYHNPIFAGENSVVCAPATPAENCGSENSPTAVPDITRIWTDQIMHPAGAYRSVAVIHTYIDWSDGAQTARAAGAPWLCVHAGAGWPDAMCACKHIAALKGMA